MTVLFQKLASSKWRGVAFWSTLKHGALVASLMLLSSCSSFGEVDKNSGITIRDSSSYGSILTDAKGQALYFFAKDVKGVSACNKNCQTIWPPFTFDKPLEELNISAKLLRSDFSVITNSSGAKQLRYKGWPLYYFVKDTAVDDIKGDAVKKVWFVAKPNYSLMYAQGQLTGADGVDYLANYRPGKGLTAYLVDAKGRTLYAFKKDRYNVNNFTKSDFSNNKIWPIVTMKPLQVPSILSRGNIQIIEVFGKKQVSYKGWPLYYFVKDSKRGDTKGVSVPKPGIWPIVNTNMPIAP